MKLGVICPSEIATRRFMPAVHQCKEIIFSGVGVYSKEERFNSNDIGDDIFQEYLEKEKEKANRIIDQYGGRVYSSYKEMILSPDIDAIYIPLPPALHFKWAKLALEHGKHVLVEKPATVNSRNTKELIKCASKRELALHENYMFTFHKQIGAIKEIIESGEIGEIRLFRICFGFPLRKADDFRYNKSLGGGALIDAGGYTIRYAMMLLGPTVRIQSAQSNYLDGFEVDMFGSATLINADGVTAQVSFGMDNNYKCELEVWGSKGCLNTGRILTAPVGFIPTATIRKGNEDINIELPADDAFLQSIKYFMDCVNNYEIRTQSYKIVERQSELIEDFKKLAGWSLDL